MVSLAAAPSLIASARSDVLLRRNRASAGLRQSVVNVRSKSSRFPAPAGLSTGRAASLAVRAATDTELDDGQIEGVRLASRRVHATRARAHRRPREPNRVAAPPDGHRAEVY
jgi:hypothetical protein